MKYLKTYEEIDLSYGLNKINPVRIVKDLRFKAKVKKVIEALKTANISGVSSIQEGNDQSSKSDTVIPVTVHLTPSKKNQIISSLNPKNDSITDISISFECRVGVTPGRITDATDYISMRVVRQEFHFNKLASVALNLSSEVHSGTETIHRTNTNGAIKLTVKSMQTFHSSAMSPAIIDEAIGIDKDLRRNIESNIAKIINDTKKAYDDAIKSLVVISAKAKSDKEKRDAYHSKVNVLVSNEEAIKDCLYDIIDISEKHTIEVSNRQDQINCWFTIPGIKVKRQKKSERSRPYGGSVDVEFAEAHLDFTDTLAELFTALKDVKSQVKSVSDDIKMDIVMKENELKLTFSIKQ